MVLGIINYEDIFKEQVFLMPFSVQIYNMVFLKPIFSVYFIMQVINTLHNFRFQLPSNAEIEFPHAANKCIVRNV